MEPHKARKRPVEVEAMQLGTSEESAQAIVDWAQRCGGGVSLGPNVLYIQTLEGPITASMGDWVIRGVQGEFYPCKPDIFAMTYDLLD